jgi:hypothetical protein
MKSLTRWALTGMALLMLAAPMTARAQEWRRPGYGYGCGWRHRDITWDRHNLRRQWRDIDRDRWALHRDIANGNWAGAQAERADIAGDLMNVGRDRRDLYRDYHGIPGPGPGFVPPSYFGAVPRTNYIPPQAYVPPISTAYGPATYGTNYYPAAPLNYAGGQGLGALLGRVLP